MSGTRLALSPGPLILAASAVKVGHTGDTSEAVLATVPIAAGLLGPNGRLRISAIFSHTNSANNKIHRIRLGGLAGSIHFARTFTTTLVLRLDWIIANAGAQNSQKGWQAGTSSFETATGALTTSAIDTASATTLVFTTQLSNAGEEGALESYSVEVLR